MFRIHPSAVVSPNAKLGANVEIGAFCVIEPHAVVGDGCRIASHAVIKTGVQLGPDNEVFEGAILGGDPQHLAAPANPGGLRIGKNNKIREYATIHRALGREDHTLVGDRNLIMANAHIAHDCVIGDHTILANNVILAGHIEVQNHAYLSGAVAVHQFCRIGQHAMVGGQAHIKRDVPPFVTVDGFASAIVGLNLIGLKRRNFTSNQIKQLKEAYRVIYRSGLNWIEVLEELQKQFPSGPAAEFFSFLSHGERGFIPERRAPRKAPLRIFRPGGKTQPQQKAA